MMLSAEQQVIVEMPTNFGIQVLASAGSGKTRVLTERIGFILSTVKKEGIIALTFTNKAAEEMADRLARNEHLDDRVWIGTIHSVAQRVLEQYGHSIGLPSNFQIYERDKDRMEVFLQSLREDGVDIDEYLNVEDQKQLRGREKVLQNYMNGFSVIKRELMDEEQALAHFPDTPNVWKIYQDYQEALLASGGIDYDDILVFAHKLLLRQEWIADIYRAKYKHLCVDEAQDLNRIQYEFIKALCGSKIQSVLMVGDPHQMIYGFNGSSSEYLCERFVVDFNVKTFHLKENYRSTRAVIRAANKLKHNSSKEHEFAVEGSLRIESFETETDEANWITSTINCILELHSHEEIEGELSLDNIVVIARNRFVFSKLEEALSAANIAYSLRKSERGEEPSSLFGKVLDYGIRVKLNPKDWVDGKKLCSLLSISPPLDWTDSDILSNWSRQVLDKPVHFPEIQSKLLQAIHDIDSEAPNIRKLVKSFDAALSSLSEQISDENQKLELERSIEELRYFMSLWTRFKSKGIGSTLGAFRNANALGQLAIDTSNSGLTLSTVHTMKGLEKDIVFLIGMCEGVFPDYRASQKKQIEEERNAAFVAVTRARRWLYITYPKQRMMPWGSTKFQVKSRFVEEIES
ncbi:ATP-dependent helicase [Thalassospira mesophila]|uniref:DNA 3'-5' helicase n=1 Tax=Thalassospira mesophila TaxID=1293891 RepID=A0A1Y2KW44_9PROT|nr:ATP-dependent helicase [Thalassospira mesophila]OSQ35772.1 DNA helicase UvrD [Thalassospira mesophila]